jgi:hypothetical protein
MERKKVVVFLRERKQGAGQFDQFPLGIADFPSSSHALLLPVFLHAENS